MEVIRSNACGSRSDPVSEPFPSEVPMRLLALAVGLLILGARQPALTGPPAAQTCTYRTSSESASGCYQYCANPPSCCTHDHLLLNWETCADGGLKQPGSTTQKFFNAYTRGCNAQCPVSGPAQCTHY